MSSALSLIVLGQVYFLGPVPNTSFVTQNLTLTLTIDQGPSHSEPLRGIRRNDYTYTPGIGGHKVHNDVATWNNARKICTSEGGHLAIINSVAESRVMAQLFQAPLPHAGNNCWSRHVHIGFLDLFGEGDSVTVHGDSLESTGFNEWKYSEPNHRGVENCGAMFKDGKLNDIYCDKSCGFVCEVPYAGANLITP